MHPLNADILRDLGTDHRNDLRREMADRRLADLARTDTSAHVDDIATQTESGPRRRLGRLPSFSRRFARGF